ncbi:MAG: hypothetical protein ABSB33_09950, partial [Tepidisphaeraceae bacterium]
MTVALVFLLVDAVDASKGPYVPYPSKSEVSAVTDELKSGDASKIDHSLSLIHRWVDGNAVPWELWHDWLPSLMQSGRNQEAADLAFEAVITRPESGTETDYVGEFMKCRMNALLNLGKSDEAQQAAKGYYNVCDLSATPDAIELVGTCLAETHPNDLEIVRRFRSEQSQASAAPAEAQPQGPTTLATAAPSILASIHIDTKPYAAALTEWSARRSPFLDRVCYANLLLVTDQSQAAEKIFRELYQL